MFVNILLNTSVSKLDRLFTYLVPNELENKVKFGIRVNVPFGTTNREEVGIVVETNCVPAFDPKHIKEITGVVDNAPIINQFNLKLARWISKRYICNLSDSLRLMLPPGITRTKNVIHKDKVEQYVCLNEDVEIDYDNIPRITPKRKEVLDLIIDVKYISKSDLYEYFNISSQFLKWFEANKIIKIVDEQVYRNPFKDFEVQPDVALKLNDEQEKAYKTISKNIDADVFCEYLLHGVTGSGKTEVYMHIINNALKNGKNAIVLVPEIALTPQIVNRFLARFGNTVAVLHSRLSMGEKIDEFNRIKNGEARIVIGARSAIFAPIKDIGIIIIDEEHDNSYKSEMTPKYDAREVAKRICQYNKCVLVYGSATPSVEAYYNTQNGNIKLIELKQRVQNATLPDIELIDLTQDRYIENSKCITQKLYDAIENALKHKEQIMLFLNKRGYSSSIVCTNCGHVFKCPNCDITLTYHSDKHRLMCHYCGYSERFNNTCTECGSNEFTNNVIGTQKVEQEISKLFPDASVIRMDKDTTLGKNGHYDIIQKFKNDVVDILIGTQMISKGHDFPNVTLVGVLNADMSLFMQDFRTNEITFELLTQVAGRAGRKNKKGKVIMQTYQSSNSVFEYVVNNDYLSLYNIEIDYRKLLTYPPFCDIIQITLTSKNELDVIDTSKKVFDYLKKSMMEFTNKNEMLLYSPTQAPLSRIDNQYRYRINIKCKYSEKIATKLKELIDDDKNFKKVTISIDVNSNKNI